MAIAGCVRGTWAIYTALEDVVRRSRGRRSVKLPFVHWIWGGDFLMVLGGFLPLSDKRYWRRERQRKPWPAFTTQHARA